MTSYSRQDVLRILHLHARQLLAWERAGLIPSQREYSFEHLSWLRKLRDLRSMQVPARNIRVSVEAMRRVAGMRSPLTETMAVRRGSRLVFRHGGALVDPVTLQLAFDFEQEERSPGPRLQVVGRTPASEMEQLSQVQELFQRAVQLEETQATIPQALALYEQILCLRPEHAPALINMGTIRYNQRRYEAAESLYRRATEVDPEYALAFFDLGNVLDEMQRLREAIQAYQRAVELVPQYADAHYNLALAYERQGNPRRALRHWMSYLRLDPVGPWASHAQSQVRQILRQERLSIVSRRATRVPVAG
ncbi:MAG: tetratricopeptide repeat protein [Acidobacteriota bacterium]|nr:tetratricopeptide repeat protein [Acidobacteriota bacterium]